MGDYTLINQILSEKCSVKVDEIQNISITVNEMPLVKVRDLFYKLGAIQHEDLIENIYIAAVPGGIRKKNVAYVGCRLVNDELQLAVYSKEGLIKQHTNEGVIYEITEELKTFIRK